MIRSISTGCVFICLLLAGGVASAQHLGEQSLVGQKIRITTDSSLTSATLSGVLTRLDSASVYLVRGQDSTPVRVPLDHISRLQIRGGTKRNWLSGGLIGAAIGGGGMALIALTDGDAGEFPDLVALIIGAGAGGGAVLGALIGSQVKSEGWQTVPKERHFQGKDAMLSPGVSVKLTLKF